MAGRLLRVAVLAVVGLLGMAVTAPAPAQHMDKALFLDLATGGDDEQRGLLLVYLRGTLHGLEAANMTLLRRGDGRLFCAPPEPPLAAPWLVETLLAYLKRYPAIPDTTALPVIATFALAETFPCAADIAR
ncbi:MAG: hypothetical protein QF926_03705 [Alphaproteobacteria bacterium]|jgi:hypothetical protein|nr:hypothetical protein [Alphaproteobacteria bacterium]